MPRNVLFVMTDQQRFDALSCHGGIARTPNLDRLAEQSVDLRQHHSQCPVCVPSRSVIFSGRYPQKTNVFENDTRVAPELTDVFHAFGSGGYRLGYFGKDHFFPDDPNDFVHDFDDGEPEPDHPRHAEYKRLLRETGRRLVEEGCHASGIFHDLPDELTTTGCIGAAARRFLNQTPTDQPFFAVVSFHDPHVPHLAPQRFAELYPTEQIPLPAGWAGQDVVTKHPRFGIKRQAQQSHLADPESVRHYLAVYAAMVSFVDEQVGSILDTLAARPDAEDTLIVFTSDHGDFGFDHGMSKKDLVLLDSLLHVPCLVRWPGSSRRDAVEAITEHVDLAPTLLDFAGLPAPVGLQGKSLGPLLRGHADTHKTETLSLICPPGWTCPYAEFAQFRNDWEAAQTAEQHPLKHTAPFNVPGDHCRSLRTADWRYTLYEDGFEELYQLAKDPQEWHNLAPDRDNVAQLNLMRDRLAQRHADALA